MINKIFAFSSSNFDELLCQVSNIEFLIRQLNMNGKKLSLVFTIIAAAVSCFSCSVKTEAQKNTNQNSGTAQTQTNGNNSEVKNAIDTSNWKTYKNAGDGFSFKYPAALIVQKKAREVRLYHTVDFTHRDPCDGRDEPPMQKKLVDFDLRIKIENKSFQSRKWEEEDRDAEIKLGAANQNAAGKIVSRGYDGCGFDEYVFPFGNNKTFVMRRQIIGLFSPIYGDFPGAKEARQLPDLLENEDEIIRGILESFSRVKK